MPQHPVTPALPVNREREMIPPTLLWAMLALALASLGLASFSVLSNRPHVGVPVPG